MKEDLADDGGVTGSSRPDGVGGDGIGRKAEHEIRVDELALVPDLLVLVQPGEWPPIRRAGSGEGPGSLPVGDASIPVELGAAPLLKGGNQSAQLRVDRTAVVALVVILQNYFPVGLHLVHHLMAGSELLQRVAAE